MSYYISPRFLDKIALHITKNFLNLPGVKVPLILGIHGRKGEGKSFQCDLVFERMGVEAVYMSAGELESPDAGDPARLIRLRYREAAELSKVRGRMAVLLINDIDAGMGRVDQFTQYTVNTQLVAGTLMNIADNPTNVQLPGSYNEEEIQRIPILVTGNDFSTLYAPLIRDGRMEKFYWEPDRQDRIGIVGGIFAMDGVSPREIEQLVGTFPNQSIDFFSVLHSRLYDEQVLQLIHSVGVERISQRVVNGVEKLPDFQKPDFSLSHLIEMGQLMVQEQQHIQELRLVREYNAMTGDREPEPNRTRREQVGNGQSSSSNGGNGGNRQAGVGQPSSQQHSRQQDSRQPSTQRSSDSYTWNAQPKTPQQPSNAPSPPISTSAFNPLALQTLEQLLEQGYRVAIEVVDERRFRTNSWQSYAVVQGQNEPDAVVALETCLQEHEQDYIRLVAINPKDRRRLSETIVQRPKSKVS